ncbi:heterokaryon incompatibility protein-domain-containing protein [Stachybotrys elegans]|uniref:Heterokaryon incompatibility protein-domain-containing protein n=1 Tax=Stachybotrys elegans TaxID=80388 RepID=A0A8K0SDD8_9HYPO|nr:heterokaryon incompatibility protein-domain-containing protein [Stachybotrys elegans]
MDNACSIVSPSQGPRGLQLWVEAYLAEDANSLDASSDVILAVESDQLDLDGVEQRVEELVAQADVSDSFCGHCTHLLHHWPGPGIKSFQSTVAGPLDTKEIEASSRAGCLMCSFLFSRLKMTDHLLTFRKIEARLAQLQHAASSSLSVMNVGTAGTQILWANFPGRVATDVNGPEARSVQLESHVLSITAYLWHECIDPLDFTEVWLSTCWDHHPQCRVRSELELPTRLVSFAGDVVKVVETCSLDEMPQYATLSYCWGGANFKKLTDETYAQYTGQIPNEDLAQTFKDALEIAKRLGVLYIWIDALCIIQDQPDQSDWLKESGRMHFVYGGSHINLAASAAVNVHEGFLSKDSFLNPPSGGFHARATTSEYSEVRNFHSRFVYEESCSDTHLGGRAWAFQERLLSPRTIHFGPYGVFWECRSMRRSQFVPNGFPGHPSLRLVWPEDKELDWWAINQNYSKTKLTFGSDRLPALAGVAFRQHQVTKEQYLAGMWKETLVSHLAWRLSHHHGPLKRPEWRAPTWSWTSIDSATSFGRYMNLKDKKQYVHVIEAWTTPSGPNQYGAIKDAAIVIGYSSLIGTRLAKKDHNGIAQHHVRVQSETFPVEVDCLDEDGQEPDSSVYLLPVLSGWTGYRGSNIMPSNSENVASGDAGKGQRQMVIGGLVLRREANGQYFRLGSFHLSNIPGLSGFENGEGQGRDYHAEFFRAIDMAEEGVQSVAGTLDSEQVHTITIK